MRKTKSKATGIIQDDSTIAESFDARAQRPDCPSIHSTRDQSACGSCWAIATAEAITDHICTASKGLHQVVISTDDILSCCTSCGNGCALPSDNILRNNSVILIAAFRCNGGYPYKAWYYCVNTGVVTGGNYTSQTGCKPYTFPPCDYHISATHYVVCGDRKQKKGAHRKVIKQTVRICARSTIQPLTRTTRTTVIDTVFCKQNTDPSFK
ncbi:unnamed protein product [Angiostrongylus costaricensis]|uniref:Pept_C1 domain-containing protein n=1 Tax=Angiostrongylus costaricensis TaxID=334426 RepID=A0A0R3PA87_ANGCS|nr:unnamed protein product [Angiostrongylus costaricensis]